MELRNDLMGGSSVCLRGKIGGTNMPRRRDVTDVDLSINPCVDPIATPFFAVFVQRFCDRDGPRPECRVKGWSELDDGHDYAS